METIDSRDWCSAKEAATLLKCSEPYIRLLARQGKVRRTYLQPDNIFKPRYWYNVSDLSKIPPIKSFKVVTTRKVIRPAVENAVSATAPTVEAPKKTKSAKTNEQRILGLVAAGQMSIDGAITLLEMLKGQ